MVNIKRKVALNLLLIMIIIFALNPILVIGESFLVIDDANLFTEAELIELNQEAIAISNSYNMDIVILTTNDANGKSSRDYGDDYFDENGYGVGPDLDGILFLIDLDNGEAYISTSGIGIRYLTDSRIESLIDLVFDQGLGDGGYYRGTMGFLSGTKSYLQSGIPSDQYSQDESVKEKNTLTPMEGILSSVAGLLASTGFFFRTKSKYKMKNPVKPLNFRNNSMINFTSEDDRLVDTIVTNRMIPKASNNDSGKSTTHTSSSGKTHGGGGRKL
ncbi:MAG: hypothetical protein GX787_10125 [Tissierellia bacterium]|nr:hypothetical protein [Tissierellia bacterium]